MSLKVGSCPNDGILSKFLICPFLCFIAIIIFSESVAAEKTARFCSEFTLFHLFISFVLEFRF